MSLSKLAFFCAFILTLLYFLSPATSEQASERGVQEINFMDSGGPISGAMADVAHAFEEESRAAHAKDPSKPIYRIISGQTASRDQTSDPTRFILSLAGGMPPDVILFDRFAVAEWASRGAFEPLDMYIDRDLKENHPDAVHPEEYFPSAWNEVIFADPGKGKQVYGIPYDIDTRALFYNKDLLIRGGFVDEKGEARPPKTWEELETMAVALTERDKNGRIKRIGFAPHYTNDYGNSWLYLYGWMNGGEFMSKDGRQATLNDPSIVEALGWMKRVYDKIGGIQNVYGFQSDFQLGALDPFLLGKIAMKIDRSYQLGTSLAQYGQNLNYGIAPPPLPAAELAKGRKTVSWMGGWCYSIPSTAKNKEAAWALIRFFSSERAQKIFSESQRLTRESQGRVFVPRQVANRKYNTWIFDKYVYSNPAIDAKVRDAARVFNDLIDYARHRPVTPVGQLLWAQQVSAMENAIFGKASPQEALDNANAIVQQDLDRVLVPPRGVPVNWNYFIVGYVALLIATMIGVFLWDTRSGSGAAAGKLARSEWIGGWLCALPWVIGFIVFTGGPILFSLMISFCEYDVIHPARFIGIDNYTGILTEDPLFWKSLWNTLYMVIGVPLGMAFGLGIALLLNMEIKGIAVWRTFFYLPAIVPMVASSILWIWILSPSSGLLNGALAMVGITGPDWLQNEHTSKLSLILMGLWTSGSSMIIWLAGLKAINLTYYEAATLDGANTWQQFRHITLPMLSPYIFFNFIMGLIGTFQIFTQAFVMTQGGPVNSTLFYAYYLFNNAFHYLNMGYAAAMAWFLFIIVMALTIAQMKLSKRWVHYESD